jgi:hypothetical protein
MVDRKRENASLAIPALGLSKINQNGWYVASVFKKICLRDVAKLVFKLIFMLFKLF